MVSQSKRFKSPVTEHNVKYGDDYWNELVFMKFGSIQYCNFHHLRKPQYNFFLIYNQTWYKIRVWDQHTDWVNDLSVVVVVDESVKTQQTVSTFLVPTGTEMRWE